jgi:hypothetical protein
VVANKNDIPEEMSFSKQIIFLLLIRNHFWSGIEVGMKRKS